MASIITLIVFPYKVVSFVKSEDRTTSIFIHIYHLGENYFQKGRGGGSVWKKIIFMKIQGVPHQIRPRQWV